MMKFLLSKHSRSIFIFALLSLFLCMAAGKASAKERNPVVKIDNTSYTSSGTEVTLRLWMFNWKYAVPNTKKYNARFTGDVSLYIDDKEVGKLNSMWGLISGSSYTFFKDEPGIVGKSSDINLDGTNVGTAQFQDLKSVQTCPYNNNTTENSWYTVDLKLSFNKSFSYYGHKITVKGKWQDQGSGSVVEKNVTLDNTINGFVRPVNLSAQPSGGNMVFSWEQEGYNPSASTDGKWIVYKREGDNNVKVGEAAANEHSLSIEKKQNSCSNVYIMTFLPKACEVEETVCGLTATFTATEHQINVDDICQICGHSFFRYQTTDGNKVDISNKDFGATVVAHEVVDGKCVIEFDAPITKIPTRAFYNCKNLTGNLVLPNSVTTIGEQAFSGCFGFTGDLTIPNSVKTIGESAFSGCSGFTGDLIIPNSVTTIRKRAFYGCSGFTGSLTLPNSVTTIESSAFYNCKGFTGDLSLPKSLEVVGTGFLEKCNNIQTITFLSLPIGISGYLGDLTKTVSLSDDSYISSNKEDGTIDAISYTRTMSSNWGTLVLPYPLTLTGDEPYRLYAIDNMTGEELVLKQLDGEVAAGTPCVVKRNGSESELTFGANDAELNMTIDGKTVGDMTFRGTYWTTEVTNGYVIAKDCFWNVSELNKSDLVKGVKVKPFRAWLDGTSPNGASQLSICVSDTATGIGAAGTIDVLNDTATEYYDLSGKRLDEPQKGVNIVRMKSGKTKKIIIK
ncbi:leucine-rich repeat domain-containing protein [uncultured Prevotella sp.]|uniref:leucine-rich repeat domain-containing protein n=1 Tax=uncultured Prevotella sp. TaxID=159272 RepID=UPI0027E37173|nr:leucine-rich repeat domain-containing protein [uncultured Prevotella sp.]